MKKFLFVCSLFFSFAITPFGICMKKDSVKNNENKKIEIPREIEIKFRVSDEADLGKIYTLVHKKNFYKGMKKQVDCYFDTDDKTLKNAKKKLRIRSEQEIKEMSPAVSFCFKYKAINPNTNQPETQELEAKITDKQRILKIFKVLELKGSLGIKDFKNVQDIKNILDKNGYTEFAKVKKIRSFCQCDCFEVAMDAVKNLGEYFIEVELKKEGISAEIGKQMIYTFLRDVVGLQKIDEYPNDYLSMQLDPKLIVSKTVVLDEVTKKS